jgi:hypothetical protein
VERQQLVAEAHLLELVDGAGREAVAAGLLARERLALDDGDVVALLGQPVAGGGARRSGADDEHLGRQRDVERRGRGGARRAG